jgi:hypothetical protein
MMRMEYFMEHALSFVKAVVPQFAARAQGGELFALAVLYDTWRSQKTQPDKYHGKQGRYRKTPVLAIRLIIV